MNAFDAASKVEALGLVALGPWLDDRAYQGRVVYTAKGDLARFLQQTVGDVVMNVGPREVETIELKFELVHTGNLFLETWSNRNLESRASHAERGMNPGWLTKIRASKLVYYFIGSDDLYLSDLFRLKQWAFGHGDIAGRLSDFREVAQSKYNQLNDTLGRLVPVDVLCREAGMMHLKGKQLAMPF